jgi:hypothetical protein
MDLLETQMSDTLSLLETDIPILSAMQRQGDVLIVPLEKNYAEDVASRWLITVPEEGVVLADGGEGGHQHRLFAVSGNVRCRVLNSPDRAGTLWIDENSSAILAHDEHAYLGIGPGVYEVRRQREHTGLATRQILD